MRNTLCPKARSANLVIQTLASETLVYDLNTHEAHCLNETASFVWNNCNGDISIDEIARSAETRFGRPVNADLVRLAVTQLNEHKLLSATGIDVLSMPGRREAIKKIGLASAIAMPVIASMVAPQSAHANNSCICVSPAQCRIPACGKANTCNTSGLCVP